MGWYREMDNELMRDLLYKLSSESGEHARLVDDLMGCERSEGDAIAPTLQSEEFNFEHLDGQEIMRELERYDELALTILSGYATISRAMKLSARSRMNARIDSSEPWTD